MMWHATKEIARKEFIQMLRSKRLLGVGLTILIAMILVTLVAPLILFGIQDFIDGIVGEGGTRDMLANVPYLHNNIMLFFLQGIFILSGYWLFQLTAVILTSDAVASEWQNKTVFLLLSKPVPRPAFVLGKFIGIAVPLAVVLPLLLLLDYLIVVMIFPGWPGAAEWGRFFGAVGIVALGMLAFGALALFFSTMARSGVVALLLSVLAWLIVLPLLGSIQFFIDLFTKGSNPFDISGASWSTYLNPRAVMATANDVLSPEIGGFASLFGGATSASPEWWAACLALLGHTLLWLFLAILVVQMRNFE